MKEKLCTTCGHTGKTKLETKGSIGIELCLWLLFIIPGLIYTLWRLTSRYEACRKCKSSTVIPLDSPMAKNFMKES